jgi:tetratricopeptide (TPR) repeat protein
MSKRTKHYQQALNLGYSAAWDQDWDRAATYYKQALDEIPDDPKALNNLALALFELQDYSESLKVYLKAAEKSPKDPVPLEKAATLYEILEKPDVGSKNAVRAAELYLNTGDVEKAIENWSRAVVLNPASIVAHSRLAVVYERLRRIPQAVREYLHIASLMQHAGQMDKAVQVINRALKLSPDNDEAAQALVMLRDGIPLPKPTRPIGDLKPIHEPHAPLLKTPVEEPDSDKTPVQEAENKALSELATLFFEQSSEESEDQPARTGDLKSIVDGKGPLLSENVDKTKLMLHLGQAVELLTRGDTEQAAVELEQVIEIGLHHPAAYYRLGVIRSENDRLESALRYLKRSVSHVDYALGSRLLMASSYKKKEKIGEAAIQYLEALRIADSKIVPEEHADGLRQLYEPLIEAHAQTAKDKDSVQLCNTISEMLDRPQWRKSLRKIREELDSSDNGSPTPIADLLTEASSSQVVVAMSTIRQLARQGRRHAAFEEALFALQDAPTYLPLHITIGEILLLSNQIQPAIDKFTVIARSYSVRGEAGRAIDMLRKVVDLSPLDIDVRLNLIDQLTTRGQREDAVEEYLKMAEIYYSLAELAEARKTYTKALRFVEQSGLGKSYRIRILHRVADIDVQSLNWRQGLKIYEQICSIKPDDFTANRSLIDLNFRLGERKQALAGIESYIQTLNDEDRSDDVVGFLEKLSSDWPQQAIVKKYLADKYIVLGRMADAVDQLDDARAIYFDSGNKAATARMIEEIINLEPDDVEKFQQMLENIQSD